MNNYGEALDWLMSLPDAERKPTPRPARESLLLERPTALLKLLGEPQTRYHSVLIGGTKGKGSTAAFLESILRAAGYKTGLYTSPHLHSYRERIRINGVMISEQEFASGVGRLTSLASELLSAHPDFEFFTTFEVMTALALDEFARQRIDIAVLEVGLGGRLDATNAVVADLSIITSISFDHMAVLGDTLPKIANEKAGIVKDGKIVLSAPQAPEVMGVIERVAKEKRAAFGLGGKDWKWQGEREDFEISAEPCAGLWSVGWRHEGLRVALRGAHQLENAATAVAAAETLRANLNLALKDDAIHIGLERTEWFGRLEVLQAGAASHPTVVTDGAHNGDSAEKLVRALTREFEFEKLWLVVGVLRDKDLHAIVAPFTPLAEFAWTVTTRHPRSREAEDLANQVGEWGMRADPAVSVSDAIKHAMERAAPRDLICITGSLSTVAEAREFFDRAAWAHTERFRVAEERSAPAS